MATEHVFQAAIRQIERNDSLSCSNQTDRYCENLAANIICAPQSAGNQREIAFPHRPDSRIGSLIARNRNFIA